MSHPRTHPHTGEIARSIREFFGDDIERPLLIVGNGPSAAVPRYELLPDDPIVFRMNWFFLEDRYHYGREVDGFFYSIPNAELERHVARIVREGWYDVRAVFSPMRVPTGRENETHRSELYVAKLPEMDHWSAIAEKPALSRFMMSRPLPTQGVQVLAAALQVGFRDITICGVDMYESSASRYGYVIPDSVAAALQTKDLTPGYETLHTLDRDLDFLDCCIKQYGDARISQIGPSKHLAARLPAPERRTRRCTFGGVDAVDHQTAAKPNFDTGTIDLSTDPGEELPYRLVDGKRCGFVTLVSGPFHHGARALARSLANVSDIPLTVMCTPSADRAALKASGISCIDIPEIRNPNKLGQASKRFAPTYSKLNAFRMTHLDRAVYVDSDMIVLKSIDDLFENSGFQAVADHGLEHEYERFNSGLFAFEPDAELFDHLVDATDSVTSYDQGDQGFLNEMFRDWQRLPHSYNVSKRWPTHHPNLFHLEESRVIHFVGIKPWQFEAPSAYDELYRLWYSFLDADELIELVEELRQTPPVKVRSDSQKWLDRLVLRAIRRGSAPGDQRAWEQGTLLRRAQARNANGAHREALDLLLREWPGDESASSGLLRERAKSRMLCGQIDAALGEFRDAAARFPASSAISANLAALERIEKVRRLTRHAVPDKAFAQMARIAMQGKR